MTIDSQLIEVPTKTGEIKPLTHDQVVHLSAQWFPDEKRVLFLGGEPGHGPRFYVPDLKFFGDIGAHNRMMLVKKADLDRLHQSIRSGIEEMARNL